MQYNKFHCGLYSSFFRILEGRLCAAYNSFASGMGDKVDRLSICGGWQGRLLTHLWWSWWR